MGGRFGVSRDDASPANPVGIQLLHNLICGNRLGEIEGPALDATDQGNLTPTGGEGPGVTASPGCATAATVYTHVNGIDQLASTVDDDVTLAAGSPALDRGRDLGTLGLPSAVMPRLEADFSREGARPRAGTTGGEALFDLGAMQTAPADTQGPTVTFLQPAAGAHVRQTVTVQAQATDTGRGVATLALMVESQTLTSSLSPTPPGPSITATAPWDTTTVEDGAHMLTTTAQNQGPTAGTAQRAVIVDNTPPATQIIGGPTAISPTSATVTYAGTDNMTAPGVWCLPGGWTGASSRASPRPRRRR